jgi:hypothetical protein
MVSPWVKREPSMELGFKTTGNFYEETLLTLMRDEGKVNA